MVTMATEIMIFNNQSRSYIDGHQMWFLKTIFGEDLWNYFFSQAPDFTFVIFLDSRCLGKNNFTNFVYFISTINYKKLAPSKFDLFLYFVAKELLIEMVPVAKNGTIQKFYFSELERWGIGKNWSPRQAITGVPPYKGILKPLFSWFRATLGLSI